MRPGYWSQLFDAGPYELTALDLSKASHVSLNAPFTNTPSAKTTRMMMAAIAATSSPYSTADAPSSSRDRTLSIKLLTTPSLVDRGSPPRNRGCRDPHPWGSGVGQIQPNEVASQPFGRRLIHGPDLLGDST